MFLIRFILIFLLLINLLFAIKEQEFSKNSNLKLNKIKSREFDKSKFCRCRTIKSRAINATIPFGEYDFQFLALIYIVDEDYKILRSVCSGIKKFFLKRLH